MKPFHAFAIGIPIALTLLSRANWKTCAQRLNGYTCGEIEHIVNEAARHALGRDQPISTKDILYAAEKTPPAHADAAP